MAQSTPATSLAALDVAAGAAVAGGPLAPRPPPRPARRGLPIVRAAAGLGAGAAGPGAGWAAPRGGRPAGRALPIVRAAAGIGAASAPRAVVSAVRDQQRQGRRAREQLRMQTEELLRAAVPVILDFVLDQVDLTALVLRRVDLDAVAARLDLDAAAARLDIDKILDRIDFDAVVAQRVDLDPIAARLDIDKILDRIDFDAVVAQRVDLDPIAARLDIDKILDRIDFDAVVAQRVDLIGLAEYVVDGIDLPRIIRESTGSVASESLRGVRTRSMDADQAVAAVVDRMLLRRRTGRDRAHQNAHQNGSASAPPVPPGGGDAD